MMKYYLCFLFLFLWALGLKAQKRLENTLLFGKADASKILRAYTEPGFQALGAALAEGWHASARPLHAGKFNFQLAILGGFSDNQSVDLQSLGLQVGQVHSTKTTTATSMGTSGGILLLPNNSINVTQELDLPDGISLPFLPIVCTQFNFGLLRNTELNLRLGVLPINEDLLIVGGWGFKHELKQWFPAIALANFDVSVFANFSQLALDYKLDIDNFPNNPNNQFWKARANNFAVGTIFSKRLSLFTLTTGVQYAQSTGDMELTGTYLVGNNPEPAPTQNPISEKFASDNLSLMLALRLNLGFFSVQVTSNLGRNPSAGVSFILGRVQRR